MKRSELFFVIIKDDDEMEFNLVGPVVDDTPYIKRIVEEQKKGRKVVCDTSKDKESAIITFIGYGYKYVPERDILG